MPLHYDPITRPQGGLCRERSPVNFDGVPTLPDWLVEKIKAKEEPSPEEQELAKPAIEAAMAELRKRIQAETALKTKPSVAIRHYATRRRSAEPRQMAGDYAALADCLAEEA